MRPTLIAALATLLTACGGYPDLVGVRQSELATSVRAGTSFGMCLGYCRTELSLEGDTAVLLHRGWNEETHPPLEQRLLLVPADRERLLAAADVEALGAVPAVIGCPDCADGGAEWVEVEHGGRRVRVTLEHGAEVREIASLLREIRSIRSRFPPVR